MISLLGLDPGSYERHAVHRGDRSYLETNCYTDILIELLHARGHEPLAALGSLVRQDFEGDQFTFFKPPPGDVEALFGIDVHEMNPWRSVPEQAVTQLALGRTITVELDSFWLPDVAATDYQRNHVKSSVVVEAIDVEAQVLRYWHNAGYFELLGEDYRGVFRIGGEWSDDVLVPYTELVRFDAGRALSGEALLTASRAMLAGHLRMRPSTDPFSAFGAQLASDLPALLEGDAEGFHAYAFPTVRIAGAAAELLASHATYLYGDDASDVVLALDEVVERCKVLSFRLARRRAFEPAPIVEGAASGWSRALDGLTTLAG